MVYSVNWTTKVVTIPQADLISLGGTEYELNVVTFWQNIHDIQDNGDGVTLGAPDAIKNGIVYDQIMNSNAPTDFGPRGVLIINGYKIEFEDGQYTVNLTNANSDIASNLVQNQVSVRDRTVTGASPQEFWGYLLEGDYAAQELMRIITSAVAGKGGAVNATTFRYRDIADTKDRIDATVDGTGNRTNVTLDGD